MSTAVQLSKQFTALFVGSDDLCDPDLEDCPTSEDLTDYEDYERFTLLLGIMMIFFGYLPAVFFAYPIWYGINSDARTKILNDHFPYFLAWVWMAGSHFLFVVPWHWSWVFLFFSDPPYEGANYDFYSWWLTNLIAPGMLWLVILTGLGWLACIFLEFDKEDDVFLIVYPVIVTGIYLLVGPITVALVIGDWEKAILYFDKLERERHEAEIKRNSGPQVIGGDDIIPEQFPGETDGSTTDAEL